MAFIGLSNPAARLWKYFEKNRCLSRTQFTEAEAKAKAEGRYLTDVLLDRADDSAEKIRSAIAQAYGLQEVSLRKAVIALPVLNLIPREVAEQHSVVVFKKIKDVIHVATTIPENEQTINFIRKKTGLTPIVFVATAADIRRALRRYQSELSEQFAVIIENSMREALATHDSAEKMANFVPVIRMVNAIIERALVQRASDIHIEPLSKELLIRFRIDGLLQKVVSLPRDLEPSIVARIKLMSNLKIDEHRQPQDGRCSYRFGDKDVALRIAIIPTLNGSTVTLRLLDASKEKSHTLGKLGFNKRDYNVMQEEILKSQGMILVTGPTGSGKTTTLYCLLQKMHQEAVNICTVEDPIEYGIDGINQTQINKDGGITFATGLRSLLRHDPDVIMVGEIRDVETADIAVNAAMTGHVVLSTFHTNNAFLAPQRLIEMGVQPYLIASVVNVIIGQRLVRKICKHCCTRGHITSKQFDRFRGVFDLHGACKRFVELGLLPTGQSCDDISLSIPQGCDKCGETGFNGRIGIYEVLQVTEDIRTLFIERVQPEVLREHARKSGLLTMEEDGLYKVFKGVTTFNEILRVTRE